MGLFSTHQACMPAPGPPVYSQSLPGVGLDQTRLSCTSYSLDHCCPQGMLWQHLQIQPAEHTMAVAALLLVCSSVNVTARCRGGAWTEIGQCVAANGKLPV